MKQRNVLFYVTGGWFVFMVLAALYFLLQTMAPSADVTGAPRSTVYTLNVGDIEPGQTATYRLDGTPVIVWRRNFSQQVQALELLDVDVSDNADLLEEVRISGGIQIAPDQVLHLEWLVLSPINPDGYGCIVLADTGDLGGFFDPCQGVHFDLWGRVVTGPTESDLQAVPWAFSDEGRVIMVDVGDAPRLE